MRVRREGEDAREEKGAVEGQRPDPACGRRRDPDPLVVEIERFVEMKVGAMLKERLENVIGAG